VHRSTVYDAIRQIQKRFAKGGLEDYLPKTRSAPTESDDRW
jgi:hypothetical protein